MAAKAATAAAPTPLAKAMETIHPCRRSGESNDIVVCRTKESPYRIPEALRPDGFDYRGATESVSRERNRLIEPGAGGTLECSNVGTAGHSGCKIREFRAWKEQKAGH